MFNIVACPSCFFELKCLPRHLGKKVRCSRCNVVFSVPNIVEPPSPTEEAVLELADPVVASDASLPFAELDLGPFEISESNGLFAATQQSPLDYTFPISSPSTAATPTAATPTAATPTAQGTKAKQKDPESNASWLTLIGLIAGTALVFIIMLCGVGLWWYQSVPSPSDSKSIADNPSQPAGPDSSKASPNGGSVASSPSTEQRQPSNSEPADSSRTTTSRKASDPRGSSPPTTNEDDTRLPTTAFHEYANWKRLDKQANRENKALFAQFLEEKDQRKLRVLPHRLKHPIQSEGIKSSELATNQGLELREVEHRDTFPWKWTAEASNIELVEELLQGDDYSVTRLSKINKPFEPQRAEYSPQQIGSQHRHLWSEDGKYLYVLSQTTTSENSQHITKLDTRTWKIVAKMQMPSHNHTIDSMCWSSQGIVIITSMRNKQGTSNFMGDIDEKPWIPLSDGYASYVITIEPDTLGPLKAWHIPSVSQIIGRQASEIVYGITEDAGVLVLDLKRGQILNALRLAESQMNRFIERDLHDAKLSDDGVWLFSTKGSDTQSLNRFRLKGWDVEVDQKVGTEMPMARSYFSRFGNSLTYRSKDGYERVSTMDMGEKSAPTVSGPPNGQYQYDEKQEIGYVCGREGNGKPLKLSIFLPSKQLRLTLEKEDQKFLENEKRFRSAEYPAPYAMALSPDGRGVMVFDYGNLYWVESKSIVQEPSKSDSVKVASLGPVKPVDAELNSTATPAHLKPPKILETPIVLELKPGNHAGQVWSLPTNVKVSQWESNSATGDIALKGSGPIDDSKQDKQWIGIAFQDDIQPQRWVIPRVLSFSDDKDASVEILLRHFGEKSYLLALKNGVIWIFDPRTLNLVGTQDVPNNPIEISKLNLHKSLTGAFKDNPIFEIEVSNRIFNPTVRLLAHRDDDPWVVVGANHEYKDLILINFLTGELKRENANLCWASWRGPSIKPSLYPFEDGPVEIAPGITQQRGVNPGERPPGTVEGNIARIAMTKHPFLVCTSKESFTLYDQQGQNKIGEIPYATPLRNPRLGDYQIQSIHDDFQRDRLVVHVEHVTPESSSSALWVVPYPEAEIPDTPSLETKILVPNRLESGREVVFRILPLDPRVELKLSEEGEQIKLIGNELRWTPKPRDLGERIGFSFRVSAGGKSTIKHFSFLVNTESDDNASSIVSVHFVPNRPQALLVRGTSLSLVDLETQETFASHEIGPKKVQAHATSEAVYVFYPSERKLEKRSLNDLSLELARHTWSDIQNIQPLGDKFLILFEKANESRALNPLGTNRFSSYRIPSLEQDKLTKLFDALPPIVSETADGEWRIGPVVMDKELKAMTTLVNLNFTGAVPYLEMPRSIGVQETLLQNTSHQTDRQRVVVGECELQCKLEDKGMSQNRQTLYQLELHIKNSRTMEEKTTSLMSFTRLRSCSLWRHNDMLVVTCGSVFHTFSLRKLGIDETKTESSPPLRIRPKDRVTTVLSQNKVDIKFLISGGKPPYKMECSFPFEINRRRLPNGTDGPMADVDLNKRTVTIVPRDLTDAMLKSQQGMSQSLAAIDAQRSQREDREQMLIAYSNEFAQKSKSLISQSVKGVPLLVPMQVKVTDGKGNSVSLVQDLVVALPTKTVLDYWDKNNTISRASRSELSRLEREYLDLMDRESRFLPPSNPSEERFPTVRGPQLVETTPESLSEEIRQMWKHKEIRRDLSLDHLLSIDYVSRNWKYAESNDTGVRHPLLKPLESRSWQRLDETEVKGRFGGYVTSPEKGIKILRFDVDDFGFRSTKEQTLPFNQLKPTSLNHAVEDLRNMPRPVANNLSFGSPWINAAIEKFAADFGCLPPPAIVDSQGKPLLSWRVLLLPYLGHPQLFEAFRLDEPWDSPHNLKLLPYMPLAYSPTPTSDPNKTTVLAVKGQDAAFQDHTIRRLSDIPYRPEELMLLTEVDAEYAVEWTKPEDIEDTPNHAWASKLLKFNTADGEEARGWFANGRVLKFQVRKGTMVLKRN